MPKVLMLTRSLNVTLISAQENIDETPGRIQRILVERGRSRYPLQDGPESKERRRPRAGEVQPLKRAGHDRRS
jgi:hypothetical protein